MSAHELSPELVAEPLPTSVPFGRRLLRQIRKRPLVALGVAIIVVWLIVGIFAPLIAPHDPLLQNFTAGQSPSGAHPFGTDELGRDVLSRVIYGARISLPLATLVVFFSLVIGITLGVIAGYFRGVADGLIMRTTDLVFAFPAILLAFVVTAALGKGLQNAVLALVIVSWPAYARVVRALVLSIGDSEYVAAGRLLGASSRRTIVRDVLPNFIGPVIVLAMLEVAAAVLLLSGLSFLGLGAQPPTAEWGGMAAEGVDYFEYWWMSTFPGIAIFTVVLAFNFVGDGLRDIFDPRVQGREPLMAALLEVENMSIKLPSDNGPITIVDRVDFAVAPGEIFGVAGESGSGKTMTTLALLRLLPRGAQVDGRAMFDGTDLLKLSGRSLRQTRGNKLAMVFQDPMTSLHPMLSIERQMTDHLKSHLGMRKKAAHARAIELLDDVRLPDPERALRSYPHQFSGGMRQRIAIAIALACQPSLLIADEPTTALDVTVQAGIISLLARLRREHGLAVILITHDLGVMSTIADRLTIFYAGRVVESGPMADVIRAARHPYTRGLLAALPHPEADERRPLVPIPGIPASPQHRPPGCAFNPRCGHATDDCRTTEPPLVELPDGRRHACLVDPYAA